MNRIFVAAAAIVALFVALFVALPVGAAGASSSVGSASVDPRTGVVTWTDVVHCTPGDDVEIVIEVVQRGAVAFTEPFFECPESGTRLVTAETRIEEGSSPLRPGPARVYFQRVDYLAASDYQDSIRSSATADVRLDADPR